MAPTDCLGSLTKPKSVEARWGLKSRPLGFRKQKLTNKVLNASYMVNELNYIYYGLLPIFPKWVRSRVDPMTFEPPIQRQTNAPWES